MKVTNSSFWFDHKARLRSYIISRVRDKHAVDDILQDVFLKAHTSLHTVKTPGSITSWLFRITANAIADHYRSQKPWAQFLTEPAAVESETNHVAELAACLQPLIAELPEMYRSALMLTEIDELPQKEVAKRLGISLSCVKARLQRGRKKLRRKVLDCCDIEISQNRIIGYTPRKKLNNCDCG